MIDPRDYKVVPNQRPLYAFGAKNFNQLKKEPKSDPRAGSWEKLYSSSKTIYRDVCHELMWAATGEDLDREYNICVGDLELDQESAFVGSKNPFSHIRLSNDFLRRPR